MIFTLISLINTLFRVLSFLILVEVIASWVLAARVRLPDWGYRILRAIHAITAPVLEPVRRLIPPLVGLDFSPLIALILLDLLRSILVRALIALAR
jgi:YggT family protein